MKHRQTNSPPVAAAKASFSTSTAYRLDKDRRLPSQKKGARSRRRPDPLASVFETEVVPMLRAAPGVRAVAIFEEMLRRHPELGAGRQRDRERQRHAEHECRIDAAETGNGEANPGSSPRRVGNDEPADGEEDRYAEIPVLSDGGQCRNRDLRGAARRARSPKSVVVQDNGHHRRKAQQVENGNSRVGTDSLAHGLVL